MNKNILRAIAYAQNALSFIFLDKTGNLINQIYIFGSASRGDLTEGSDIDLFIDCKKEDETKVGIFAKKAVSEFYKSKDHEKWKLLRFSYPITLQVGDLKEWQLRTSIKAEGILIYSKEPLFGKENSERKVLFVIGLPKDNKKYLKFIRKLYGRREKGYREHGVLLDLKGIKLSASVFMIPKENQHTMIEFLNGEKVNYSMKEIAVFS